MVRFLGAWDGIRRAANGAATFVNVPKDWPPSGQSCQVPVVPNASCERLVGSGLGVVVP
jgi:hypothetical protein